MYVVAIRTSENACRFSIGGSSSKHRTVAGRASSYSFKDFRKLYALFRHRAMPGRAPTGSHTLIDLTKHRTGAVKF